MRTKHFFVPYAYDHIDFDAIPQGGAGTKARCDRLIELMRVQIAEGIYHSECCFIYSAGFSGSFPNRPQTIDEAHRGSLAAQMQRYVSGSELVSGFVRHLIADELVWGTLGETEAAIATIKASVGLVAQCADVWICSNRGHVPRIWLCWRALAPRHWQLHFLAAEQSFTWKERIFKEPWKFLSYSVTLAGLRLTGKKLLPA